MRSNPGFSVVELVVVIVITGILATIAVPINSNTTTKEKMSEADVSLTTIRTHLRIHHNKTGSYPTMAKDSYVIGADWHSIESGQLTGKYFTDYSYTIESTPTDFTITCVTGDILPANLTMNSIGVLVEAL